MQADLATVLEFLTQEFDRGLKYSTICGNITAISKVTSIESNTLIQTFKKGAYNLRPPKTKYHAIWDPNQLLTYLETMDETTPMGISMKTTALFMLLLGQRVNTLSHMKITNMYMTDTECTFIIDEVLKHSRPGYHQRPLVLRSFPDKESLCPVNTIRKYLEFRLDKSNDEALFIRWIKRTLEHAGIDQGIFQAHSVRSASTSKAKLKGVSLSTIAQAASWSTTSTFKKFYDKEIIDNFKVHSNAFEEALLSDIH